MVLMRGTVVICGLATMGSAGRSQFGNAASVATETVKKIGSLLQASGKGDAGVMEKFRAHAEEQATPGVSDHANVLKKVIAEIEKNVDAEIINSHKNTQAELEKRIVRLQKVTKYEMRAKAMADQLDQGWYDCVANEKAGLERLEQAEADIAKARTKMSVACRRPKSRSEYRAAKQRCSASRIEVQTKQRAYNNDLSMWFEERWACQPVHEERDTAMCMFGMDLQAKCAVAQQFETLRRRVDRSGEENGRSHEDRVGEWETSHLVKCMLKGVIEGGEINEASLAACKASVDYSADVGVLDTKDAEYTAVMGEDKFNCKDNTATFATGKNWITPLDFGLTPKSSDYRTEDFNPEVNLAKLTLPFPFCGAALEGLTELSMRYGAVTKPFVDSGDYVEMPDKKQGKADQGSIFFPLWCTEPAEVDFEIEYLSLNGGDNSVKFQAGVSTKSKAWHLEPGQDWQKASSAVNNLPSEFESGAGQLILWGREDGIKLKRVKIIRGGDSCQFRPSSVSTVSFAEAEITEPFELSPNGKRVVLPDGTQDRATQAQAKFMLTCTEPASLEFWIEYTGPDSESNSVFIKGGLNPTKQVWHLNDGKGRQWASSTRTHGAGLMEFDKGVSELIVSGREDGIDLRQLRITRGSGKCQFGVHEVEEEHEAWEDYEWNYDDYDWGEESW